MVIRKSLSIQIAQTLIKILLFPELIDVHSFEFEFDGEDDANDKDNDADAEKRQDEGFHTPQ